MMTNMPQENKMSTIGKLGEEKERWSILKLYLSSNFFFYKSKIVLLSQRLLM